MVPIRKLFIRLEITELIFSEHMELSDVPNTAVWTEDEREKIERSKDSQRVVRTPAWFGNIERTQYMLGLRVEQSFLHLPMPAKKRHVYDFDGDFGSTRKGKKLPLVNDGIVRDVRMNRHPSTIRVLVTCREALKR